MTESLKMMLSMLEEVVVVDAGVGFELEARLPLLSPALRRGRRAEGQRRCGVASGDVKEGESRKDKGDDDEDQTECVGGRRGLAAGLAHLRGGLDRGPQRKGRRQRNDKLATMVET